MQDCHLPFRLFGEKVMGKLSSSRPSDGQSAVYYVGCNSLRTRLSEPARIINQTCARAKQPVQTRPTQTNTAVTRTQMVAVSADAVVQAETLGEPALGVERLEGVGSWAWDACGESTGGRAAGSRASHSMRRCRGKEACSKGRDKKPKGTSQGQWPRRGIGAAARETRRRDTGSGEERH